MIRLGLIVRGDNGGLASQTYDLYKHLNPKKVLLIDYDIYTGYKTDYSKYEDADNLMTVDREPSEQNFIDFMEGLDVILTVECPYNHVLYTAARRRGVKTICQYNYELLAQHNEPDEPHPDLYLAPSTWHIKDMEKFGVPVKYLHVPIDRQRFPYTQRKQAKTFLHIAGHTTIGDRNGTALFMDAIPFIQSDVKLVIRSQSALPRATTDHKLTIEIEDLDNNQMLYRGEDVLVLPRRYGGLSLQLNEAMSLGMIPLMTDLVPQNEFLNPRWLVASVAGETITTKLPIQTYACTPEDLAKKIDEMAESKSVPAWSQQVNDIAEARSWRVMRPQYEALFESL